MQDSLLYYTLTHLSLEWWPAHTVSHAEIASVCKLNYAFDINN